MINFVAYHIGIVMQFHIFKTSEIRACKTLRRNDIHVVLRLMYFKALIRNYVLGTTLKVCSYCS